MLDDDFETNFWSDWAKAKDDPRVVRIAGKQYWIGNAVISTPHNGLKGQWFDIEFFDGRKVRTCDLWLQGEIPDAFKEILPDNARLIDSSP